MLTSGVLLREVSELITSEQRNGVDGPLRSRILSLVFLISRLSREGFADTGVRTTPDHIADLLVDDLSSSGQELRRRVPTLLDELTSESKLSLVDGEYILQSKTGQEWNQDYKNRIVAYKADVARVTMARETLIREELQRVIPRSFQHGVSKTSRTISIQFGSDAPSSNDDIPVWVRSGWEISESDFQAAASAAPTTSPVVYVFIPKLNSDELTDALAGLAAGSETISQRPNPTTNEGQEAKKAIQTFVTAADAAVTRLTAELIQNAIVRQAGGSAVAATSLASAVDSAVKKSLDRLFPKFAVADSAAWHLVLSQAMAGKPDALSAVGYAGEPSENPIGKEVLATIPATGSAGLEVRNRLTGSPFGWPRDAVDGALAILVLAGNLNAQLNGTDIAASELKSTSIGKTTFRRESVTLDMATRLRARGVLTAFNISFNPNEEAPACSTVASSLDALLRSAGGDAPLPAPMSSPLVDELKAKSGAELVQFVALNDSTIKELAQTAKELASKKDKALKEYRAAEALILHLPSADSDLQEQFIAVSKNRNLLEKPDPVAPIVVAATELLRQAISAKYTLYATCVASALLELELDESWKSLSEDQRSMIKAEQRLVSPVTPALGTSEEVLVAVRERPLDSWDDVFAALPARISSAQDRAVHLLEPEAVKVALPKATLKSQDDIDAFIDSVRTKLTADLAEHKSIIV